MRVEKCKDCPFSIENTLNFPADIYEITKEKNRGKLHRCHKIHDLCVGFVSEAKERGEFDETTFYDESEALNR